ncbi:MAG: AAA family ATPase [Streptomyces sp.]|nr:AAA family ATPase [Streptomyces sp.]
MTGPLYERDDTYALLAAEIERAADGAGGTVLLRGATGTGRTAALEAAVSHATAHGLHVLRARCFPEGAELPFATVLHLLGQGREFTQGIPGDEAGDSATGRRRQAAQLWRQLRSYAARTALLLAVDDVHLADDPSRRWLVDAARHIDELPVLLVATERCQYDIDPQLAGFTHALPPSLVRTHTLAPLTGGSAAELCQAAFPTAGARWAADCARAGAGSPLLLRALLEDLSSAPSPDLPETCAALYPGAYTAAVAWWLDSAGPATAEVAGTLAVLERSWPQAIAEDPAALLADVAWADPVRVSGWLTAMTRLGLLRPDTTGRLRYAHPLLRDAVLTDWSEVRRQQVHREAYRRLGKPAADSLEAAVTAGHSTLVQYAATAGDCMGRSTYEAQRPGLQRHLQPLRALERENGTEPERDAEAEG